jgi:hypothetical protein
MISCIPDGIYEIKEMDSMIGKYCTEVLRDDKSGLVSNEKYVLTQILFHFGLVAPVDKTVKELVQLFEMSEAVYKRSRDGLIAKGLLEERKVSVLGRGRARMGLVFSSAYLGELGDLVSHKDKNKYKLPQQSLVGELLDSGGYWKRSYLESKSTDLIDDVTHKERQKVGSSELKLKPSTRILMCILLVHSSVTGVVSGLGRSDLRKLTGMKRDKLVSHLSRLKSIGFLRHSVAGLTGGELLGVTKSEYILNLGWIGFEEKILPALVTIYVSPLWGADLTCEASGLYAQAKSIGVKVKGDIEDVYIRGFIPKNPDLALIWPVMKVTPELAKYFLDSNKLNIGEMLQFKIEQYASDLLNKYLSRLPLKDNTLIKNILDDIAINLLPAKYIEIEETKGYLSPLHKAELVKLIYEIARSIAEFIRSKIIVMDRYFINQGMNIYRMHHLLLPKATDRDLMSFCLLSYPEQTRAKDTHVLFIRGEDNKRKDEVSVKNSMEDIPSDVRAKYRL